MAAFSLHNVRVTRKGIELGNKLNPSIGSTRDIDRLCSLICRAAATHGRLSEEECNGPGDWSETDWNAWNDKLQAKVARLEERLTDLASRLPHIDGQQITVKFSGDPRGCTVKLVLPDGRYDDWAQEGICVPQ